MPTIRQLPTSVINKIAAGEVIERPASVVKELMENSVDAGSTRVDVTIEKGGTELIRIADNGCGIEEEQLELAVTSHATSKIYSAEELFSVSTMGFRGEALASIAEVTQFLIRSRVAESHSGFELLVNGGERQPIAPCGCPQGTIMEVRNLFFNTPVRRKFLKTPQTEMGHITEAFTRIALGNPHVHFTLNHNGRFLHELPPVENWGQRIGHFFGDEIQQNLIPVSSQHGEISLTGFAVSPSVSRSHNRMQYLFLNGRFIRDRALQHALSEAYRGLLMTGRFPIVFLQMKMPADQVDVNVHPAKLEVRFQESGKLYSQLLGTLRSRFLSADLTEKVRAGQTAEAAPAAPTAEQREAMDSNCEPSLLQQKRETVGSWARGGHGGHDGYSGGSPTLPQPGRQSSIPMPHSPTPSNWTGGGTRATTSALSPRTPNAVGHGSSGGLRAGSSYSGGDAFARLPSVDEFKKFPTLPAGISQPSSQTETDEGLSVENVAGATAAGTESVHAAIPTDHIQPTSRSTVLQVQNRYLITESDDGMVVIDQHALHERILYEQVKDKVLAGSLEYQKLLVPQPVDLTPAEAAAVLEVKDELLKVGLDVDGFGGSTILVSSYPSMLHSSNLPELIHIVVDQLSQGKQRPDAKDLLDHLLSTIACKAAIKAGDRLSNEEMQALIEHRHLCQDAHHCPHGRPSWLVFSREELDKRFKRI